MVGTTLLHYKILKQLGKGGMGEVYLAEDTKLKRQVALKVLPGHVRDNTERLARFKTEAEAAAKLNHPNIAQIYSIEEAMPTDGGADGEQRPDVAARDIALLLFITMEYVDGQTLTHHIPKDGMPLDRFLEWFVPLSDALTHAHERGVTHRDLKPGNIMISNEGVPKILDFGLASIIRTPQAAVLNEEIDPDAPTETIDYDALPPAVEPRFMGTPAYMSPEQTRMQKTDHRTDVFTFGIIMYEALAGKRPFLGADQAVLAPTITQDEPEPLTAVRPELPREVWRIVRRSLEKEVKDRYQTARDLWHDMQDIRADVRAGMTGVAPAPQPLRRAALIAAGTLIAVVAAFTGWWLKPAPEPLVKKWQIATGALGFRSGPAISPDGSMIAYIQGEKLWIRDIDSLEPRAIPDSEGARFVPFWSPNSDFVGYFVENAIKKVPAQGVQSSTLAEILIPGGFISKATWTSHGTILFGFANGQGFYEVSDQGGEPRSFMLPDSSRREIRLASPYILPEDRGLLFEAVYENGASDLVAHNSDLRTTVLPNLGEQVRGLNQPLIGVAYAPSGHLIFAETGRGMRAIRFSLSSLQPEGEPFPVAAAGVYPSVSKQGTLVYTRPASEQQQQLVWINRFGRFDGTIGQPQPTITTPSLSPDGKYVAVGGSQEQGAFDIWIHEVDRSVKSRLITSPAFEFEPAWSPDGKRIVWQRNPGLAVQAVDGDEAPVQLFSDKPGENPGWSPDGNFIAYHTRRAEGDRDIWYWRFDQNTRTPFLRTKFEEGVPVFSPDGRHLAYMSNESGRFEIYIREFPDGGNKIQVSVNGGIYPRWNGKGNELFYVEGNTMMAVSITTSPSLEAGLPQRLFAGDDAGVNLSMTGGAIAPSFDVTADGQRFVVIAGEGGWSSGGIVVVENWAEEFGHEVIR